ncbi:MAG TPA: carbon storage regulator, partial [Planctomycetaceae bacterium]|nr:carbon storage regulator [Planctomycetaceae bacterium]
MCTWNDRGPPSRRAEKKGGALVLVLTRKAGQTLCIGHGITVRVLKVRRSSVQL